jgi:DNA gyrase subunit B
VPMLFFETPELQALIENVKELAHLEEATWQLTIVGKEKSIEMRGITQLAAAIKELSKPFMHIQRYKGLGEMNPEQLWETSMDSLQRQLLKVSIADALEADRWFTTLMGDDVSGRKDYIEKYGQLVRNLDV